MPKLTINGQELEVPAGTSILQAAEMLGIEIPRFCFHDRLSVPANCRMCLVEVEKAPKPQASCALPCADGMVVHTDSAVVHKARKGVLEMLLINHPLDCPICDQGGECDLQDQTMAYGFDRGRYEENKRAVKDKNLGPLIKTVMTRCIHCTRCVRFADEIAGMPEMGMTGRGEDSEIGTYIERAVSSELSGNMIDVCPVGALTNKPYAFAVRPWELNKTESIDVLDAVGSNIRLDARGPEVLRVLPRLHEDINEEWISDKTRFAVDGLKFQRLDKPYVRVDGKLQPASWEQAFAVIAAKAKNLAGHQIGALAGDLVDVEAAYALRRLMDMLGSPHRDCRKAGENYALSHPAAYRFNTGIAGIEQADALLLIGTNPRHEAAMLNARIRKRWLRGGFGVGLVGQPVELTYDYSHLGDGPAALQSLLTEQNAFAARLQAAKKPMLILGMGALQRDDGLAIQALAKKLAEHFKMIKEDWCGFNVLQTAAGRMGAIEAGFTPAAGGMCSAEILKAYASGEIKFLYLLGADMAELKRHENSFIVYQGHHGDTGAQVADVILPGLAYSEKTALYVNLEGRIQQARAATFPLGEAKEDWKIIRALSERLAHTLPFNQRTELLEQLTEERPFFAILDTRPPLEWGEFGEAGVVSNDAFKSAIDNFYMTDVISRASPTMAQCVRELSAAQISIAAEE